MSVTELPAAQIVGEAQDIADRRNQLAEGHPLPDAHSLSALGDLAPDYVQAEAQANRVGGDQLAESHMVTDAQMAHALGDLAPDHRGIEAHVSRVGGDQLGSDQSTYEIHASVVAANLAFCAAFLDDVENARIATENRIRAFEKEGHSAKAYLPQLTALLAVEHQAKLALERAVRKHPLGPWIKRTHGVGEKQGARLIAALQHPAYNYAEDRTRRGPAELWAYCGYVPGQKRQKGVKSNWNPQAKMRARLVAESCLRAKAASPYGPVYDREREKWAGRDTSDLHKHNHALRVVAKEVLKDLFLEAVRVGMPA